MPHSSAPTGARRRPTPPSAPQRAAAAPSAERPAFGRALAVASLLAIAALTLVPQPVEPKRFPPWCLVCGDLGGTDVVANVLLFTPLGFALALAGLRRRRAVLLALGVSLLVETLQLAGIPGRTGTLSDLITNTAGALLGHALGVSWPRWLTPRERTARRLAAIAAAGWLATQAFGGWLFRPAIGAGPASPRTLGATEGPRFYGWYAGHVTSASIDGAPLAHRGTGAVRVEAAVRDGSTLSATVDASDARPGLVPFVLTTNGRGRERLVLGQLRGDLVLAAGDAPLRLALRRPFARIEDGLRTPGGPALGVAPLPAPMRVSGGIRGDTLWVRARSAGGATRERALRLAPSLLWAALVPWVRPSTPAGGVVQWTWLAALLAPLGWWLAWARRPAVALAAIAIATAIGSWGIGAAFGYHSTPITDPVAAALGAATGWLAGWFTVSRATSRARREPHAPRGDSPIAARPGRAS